MLFVSSLKLSRILQNIDGAQGCCFSRFKEIIPQDWLIVFSSCILEDILGSKSLWSWTWNKFEYLSTNKFQVFDIFDIKVDSNTLRVRKKRSPSLFIFGLFFLQGLLYFKTYDNTEQAHSLKLLQNAMWWVWVRIAKRQPLDFSITTT